MKKIISILILLIVSGCGHLPKITSDEITIGGITVQKGKGRQYGNLAKAVIDLRIHQKNEAGGINGRPLRIVWEDGKCDFNAAQEAAQKMISENDVKIIIGGACSDGTLGAVKVTNPNRVILISPLATAPALSHAGEYFFRTAPSSESQGTIPAHYANENGISKVALFVESNSFTEPIASSFVDTYDGTVEMIRLRHNEEIDYSSVVSQLQAAKVGAIFINTYSLDTTYEFLEEIRKREYKILLIGNSYLTNIFSDFARTNEFWSDQEFIVGYFTVNRDQDEFQDFLSAYEEHYGHEVGLINAIGTTLDAVDVLYDAMSAVDDFNDSDQIKEYLKNTERVGFTGFMGFDENGDTHANNMLHYFDGETIIPYVE